MPVHKAKYDPHYKYKCSKGSCESLLLASQRGQDRRAEKTIRGAGKVKLKYYKRALVNFYELSEDWQQEALSNLGEFARENYYIEPEEKQTPKEHILWDLSEAMAITEGIFNAVINISNNSAMLLSIDNNFEQVKFKFV